MQEYLECSRRGTIPRYIVLFFCKHCSKGLSAIGRTNCLVCYECKTVYEVEIKMTELPRRNADAFLRKHALPAGNSSCFKVEESSEDDGSGRPVVPGKEELCSK
jgi:hypothetical protein